MDAYEQTAIYSKVSGFIKHFYVDIGQQVKKDDLLAEIFVPELDEDHQQKMAQVELDRKHGRAGPAVGGGGREQTPDGDRPTGRGESQRGQVPGGHRSLGVGSAAFDEDGRGAGRGPAGAGRNPEATRFESLGARRRPSGGGRREAAQASAEADLGKASIDVETAKAQVKVAEADERRTAAMLAYTKVTAPYDGVVTVRNANTGDYVQAATGDKSTSGAFGDVRGRPRRPGADLRGRSRGSTPAMCARERRPSCGPRR